MIPKDLQFFKFCAYGFFKNLRFFDPFIILFFREMGMSFFQIGALISIRELTTTVLEIPTGLVADTCGRKNAMVLSFLSYIFSFAAFYFLRSFIAYSFGMLIFGLGEAFRTGTHKAMILDYLEIKNLSKLKVEYYGSTRSWSQIGSAVSALIAGVLVFYSGSYKIVFLASIVPYLAGMFLMISYPKALNGTRNFTRGTNLLSGVMSNFRITFTGFLKILRNGTFLKALFNSSLFDGLFKTIKDYLQPILRVFALGIPVFLSLEEKRSTILISITYFFLHILTSVSSKHSYILANRFKSLTVAMNVSYLIGVVLAILTGVLFNIDVKIISVLVFILLYVFQNSRRPINVAYVSEQIHSDLMATGLSVESQLKTVTVSLLAPLMGLLADVLEIGIGIVIISITILVLFPLVRVGGGERRTEAI